MNDMWFDKYRPKTVDGYVFKNDALKDKVKKWIETKNVPHIMFYGPAGTGKTTLAKIILNEIGVEPADILEINASSNNGVDYIRDTITNFVSTMSFGGEMRYVLLDECLEENTPVVVMRNGKECLLPIKDLDDTNDLVKSYNTETKTVEWKPFVLFDKGIQETLRIEFENGEVVVCTPDHKWYVEGDDGKELVVKASELHNYNHILSA